MSVKTGPDINRTTIASTATLHKPPSFAPLYAVIIFVFAFYVLVYATRGFPKFEPWLLKQAARSTQLHYAAVGLGVFALLLAVFDHFRRCRLPVLMVYVRMNRALAYGTVAVVAIALEFISRDVSLAAALLGNWKLQAVAFALMLLIAAFVYVAVLHPLVEEEVKTSLGYQDEVARLRDSYDFVIGRAHEDDWKEAVEGPGEWAHLVERALWTNLFVFGGVGSGKTAAVMYPLLKQALRKFPDDPHKTPSIVLLDQKGDNLKEVYEMAKAAGREKDFYCVSPGNCLIDEHGNDVVPRDRFFTWNPVGGTEPADIRAALLLEGFKATNDGAKEQAYFRNVESEFLIAALTILDAHKGQGKTNLYDLYQLGLDYEKHTPIIHADEFAGTPAQLYFKNRFEQMKRDERGALISGLTAQLARIASESMTATFCPTESSPTRPLPSMHDLVVNRPGIFVFSVPEAGNSATLSRILTVCFLNAFQTQMLHRSTSKFKARGGNAERLVMQFTDESWAFMNPGVASFTAVSRQARVCSVFATQSLKQVPEEYRDTVLGNFRSKLLLPVNDPLTLETFSKLLGEYKELFESQSTSQSLGDVSHRVLAQGVRGKNQGVSASTSYQERLVPRFSLTEIQQLKKGRLIAHLFDGDEQQPSQALESTPHYLPEFSL